MNINLLKYFIKDRGFDRKDLADMLKLNVQTFNKKVNMRADFTLIEVKQLSNILKLSKEQIFDVFFAGGLKHE
jgi:hypothetical protein|nr:MAG TPA: Regulatory protein-modification, helix-turn-helix, transcriptional regulato, DNA [Caudoviricetes sp.]